MLIVGSMILVCRIKRYKSYAVLEAMNSKLPFQLGAIVFKGGKILSRGYNQGKYHAEHSALKQLKSHQTDGADIIVVRINTTGISMAKPCNNCQNRLRKHGIKRAFYTNSMGEIEVLKL